MHDNLISIQDAAKMLNIPYMQALQDSRLRKVRVNRYYSKLNGKTYLREQKEETPGRWPMVKMSDLEVYRLELMNDKEQKEKQA